MIGSLEVYLKQVSRALVSTWLAAVVQIVLLNNYVVMCHSFIGKAGQNGDKH